MLADARCTGKCKALWAKPVSPAREVSCKGGWDPALIAAICAGDHGRPAGCVIAAAGWR